jgi:hypothetical protein
MKYIKLFEDHGINQPEKSLDKLKSDLASMAKGTFQYAAIDTVLDQTVMDDAWEMQVAEEFNENYLEVLFWIINNINIDVTSDKLIRLIRLGLAEKTRDSFSSIDFSKTVTLWDSDCNFPAYKYPGAGSPVQIALLNEIFPDLVKPFVNNSIKNAINIDSVNMLYLPEPCSIIDKEVNLPNGEGFIYAKIAKSMGLTFISIETEYTTKFFVQL